LARALIPKWYRANHPLSLPAALRRAIQREYTPRGIFLNIPYSDRYTNLEIAILSTVTAYGLVPFMAKQDSSMGVRLHKIARMILSCKYAFTDLTYVKRMNMPFELGLLLAWGKISFVISAKNYQALKTISDLNFGDVDSHKRSVNRLIELLAKWLAQQFPNKRTRIPILQQRYRRWQNLRRALGPDFDQLAPQEIDGLIKIAQKEYKMDIPTIRPSR
jgi:hypothetical protein